jgi:hypothetical protein
MSQQIGIIHEIGDMGLGFEPISESDQKLLEDQKKKENADKES